MRGRFVWIALAAGLAGCGPSNGLTLGKVRGTITYVGQPVRWGSVLFVPDASKGTEGPQAMSTIQKDGTYVLSTESADDGAVVGFHMVGIIGLHPEPIAKGGDSAAPATPKEKMAAKSAVLTKRRRRIAPVDPKDRTMTTVDGKTYRLQVPDKVLTPDGSGVVVEVERGSNTLNFDIKADGSVAIRD